MTSSPVMRGLSGASPVRSSPKASHIPVHLTRLFLANRGLLGVTRRLMESCLTRTARSFWGRSDIGGDPIVVVLSENVSDAHLAGLRSEGVSYIFAGKSQLDLALTLDILNRELGVKRLLLEGDGGTNGLSCALD
jgi:hypothetical protein